MKADVERLQEVIKAYEDENLNMPHDLKKREAANTRSE